MKLHELKEQQKELAKEIKELKGKRKESRYGYVPGLEGKRSTYRYRHIAYCMARGRKYEEIERTCREEPYMPAIEKIIAEIELPEATSEQEVVNG